MVSRTQIAESKLQRNVRRANDVLRAAMFARRSSREKARNFLDAYHKTRNIVDLELLKTAMAEAHAARCKVREAEASHELAKKHLNLAFIVEFNRTMNGIYSGHYRP